MQPRAQRTVEPRPAWQWGLGGLLLALFGWFAFMRGTRVPLLGWIDLAIHEFGHVVTLFLPEVANAMMGNGMQTLLPLALAAVFGFRERNWLAVVVCVGWAATTLQDASVYLADAPHQRLPLIGGYHDWAFALAELGQLHRAEAIARLVWVAGLMLLVLAAAGCALGPWIEPAIAARPRGTQQDRRTGTSIERPAHPPVPPAPGPASPRQPGRPADAAPANLDADWRDYFG